MASQKPQQPQQQQPRPQQQQQAGSGPRSSNWQLFNDFAAI
jgi:hypothetical protein